METMLLPTELRAEPSKVSGWQPPSIEELREELPQYAITGLLGRGSMGAVYLGRQESLGREVALKILPSSLSISADFVRRFQREAKLLGSLSHQGVVQVFDAGETESGLLYFVMEYVPGTTLKELMPSLKNDHHRAVEIAIGICEALEYAHSKGVLHRDIKPANILISADGLVKLGDFGLARPISYLQEDQRTVAGGFMGTPRYTAPEQRVSPYSIDNRADIFSVGVVFYEMLTGEPHQDRWRLPSRLGADARLDNVVQRALREHPWQRYGHASEMQGELESIRSGAPISFGAWVDGCPFRGLNSFDREHSRIFFGRSKATQSVVAQLKENHTKGRGFCLIVGESGVGKSSLARAGVLPQLELPNPFNLQFRRVAIFQPKDGGAAAGSSLMEGLVRALAGPDAIPDLLTSCQMELAAFAELLATKPLQAVSSLLHFLATDDTGDSAASGLLLLVDQLEEIFSLAWVLPDERRNFCEALSYLAGSGKVWVIATLRSDFFKRCQEEPSLMDLKSGLGQYHLEPPMDFEIAQIVRWSAHAGGLRFESNSEKGPLEEVLIRDAARDPGALPLLSFTLDELYRSKSKDGRLLWSTYEKLNGLAGALSWQADRAYREFELTYSDQAQKAFDSLCHALVTIQDFSKGSAVRAWVHRDKLPRGAAVEGLVSKFEEARLLAIRDETVSFIHEALLECWERLTHWIETNQLLLQFRRRLRGRMTERNLLLPEDPLLAEARSWMQQVGESTFSPEEWAYLQSCVKHAETSARHRRNIRWTLIVTLAALTVTAGTAALMAYRREQDAKGAKSRAQDATIAAQAANYKARETRADLENIFLTLLIDQQASSKIPPLIEDYLAKDRLEKTPSISPAVRYEFEKYLKDKMYLKDNAPH